MFAKKSSSVDYHTFTHFQLPHTPLRSCFSYEVRRHPSFPPAASPQQRRPTPTHTARRQIIAECEVINLSQYRSRLGQKQEGDYFVVENADHVRITGLILLPVIDSRRNWPTLRTALAIALPIALLICLWVYLG
jgi:hypothetical protein